ncbi:asparaginase [Ideonella sp.]|uniref:asparaginase n=1 Tax=Ideonella sp. TaxID=1929293 RepID=UPI003BB73818
MSLRSTAMPAPELRVEVLRGGTVESFHRGSVAVMDADGAVRWQAGDIHRPIFPRSAVKLLQALPLVASGAADAFGLSDEQLALACASHGGEPAHVAAAADVLAKCGLDTLTLECGAHWPGHDAAARALARQQQEPTALHNNCSGKHAGFVCLGACLAQAGGHDPRGFLSGYVQAQHPVMREVSAALARCTDSPLADAPVGTDGCSIPTYALPLRALALGFARAGTGVGLSPTDAHAAHRLRQAVARHPFMVAGSGRFDSRVMEHFGERVFCKVGAEGVYCAALPELGLGVALKMDDGNTARAAEVLMAALLQAWVQRDEADAQLLQTLAEPVLRNWNGTEVGRLRLAPGTRFN